MLRIKRKIESFISLLYINKQIDKLHKQINNRKGCSRIYYFCTPTHSNLGDQAQYLCWLRIFKEQYPSFEIVCVPEKYRKYDTLRQIRKNIQHGDKLFIHSGYLFYDPHPELPLILDVVRAFFDYPITILPQTINIVDEKIKHIVSNQLNSHDTLTICCRDKVSFNNAQHLFNNATIKLMPDVVTSLIGDKSFRYDSNKRKGILFCLRNDGEKYYSTQDLKTLQNKFKGVRIKTTDTTIQAPMWSWDKNREKLIRNVLKEFSSYQVVVTDRYHGTIFSQVENTPVVVLSSADHKLSSGVKWFPKDKFGMNIYFANDLEEAYALTNDILKREGKIYYNPTWFKDNFFVAK